MFASLPNEPFTVQVEKAAVATPRVIAEIPVLGPAAAGRRYSRIHPPGGPIEFVDFAVEIAVYPQKICRVYQP
jgi:hypothetical protein